MPPGYPNCGFEAKVRHPMESTTLKHEEAACRGIGGSLALNNEDCLVLGAWRQKVAKKIEQQRTAGVCVMRRHKPLGERAPREWDRRRAGLFIPHSFDVGICLSQSL